MTIDTKKIFRDDTDQKLFEEQGYVVLPFLTAGEVEELSAFFDRLHPSLPSEGFVSGSYSPDFEYKKKASDEIVKVFSTHYARLFVNYKPFGAAFLYKMPSENSAVSAHQDWTIVDETRYVALNCWVPLTDANEKNGTLHVLPGSQYDTFPVLRCPTLPFFFSGNENLIMNALVPISVPAGHVVVLNQSLIHYSGPNRSSAIRKAITAGVKSADARMVFHYQNREKPGSIEVFDEEDDFLIRFDDFYKDIQERPKIGTSLGLIEYQLPMPTREELSALIKKMKIKSGKDLQSLKPNIFRRLMAHLK